MERNHRAIRFGQAVPKRPLATSLIRLALSRPGEKRFLEMVSPSTGLSYDAMLPYRFPDEYLIETKVEILEVFKPKSAYMTCCVQ